MKAMHIETPTLVSMLFVKSKRQLIYSKSNLLDMKMYLWLIFDPLNEGNLQIGRFINPFMFFVTHFDKKVSTDQWTPTLSTAVFDEFNAVIYSNQRRLSCYNPDDTLQN